MQLRTSRRRHREVEQHPADGRVGPSVKDLILEGHAARVGQKGERTVRRGRALCERDSAGNRLTTPLFVAGIAISILGGMIWLAVIGATLALIGALLFLVMMLRAGFAPESA